MGRAVALGAGVRPAAAALVGLLAAACTAVPILPPPAPITELAPGATPPPGQRVHLDGASLDEAGTALTLRFTGGPRYDPRDPCSTAYVGWAAPSTTDPDTLETLIVDVTPERRLAEGVACTAEGHERLVSVRLAQPFSGNRVLDIADQPGQAWFLAAPDGLADLPPLPAGWTLLHEGNLAAVNPDGRWQRTYAAPDAFGGFAGGPGLVEVIQAFDGGAIITGGNDVTRVDVNGAPATLYREPQSGELVLTWQPGRDGLAIVANEADFSVEELLAFAAGIVVP